MPNVEVRVTSVVLALMMTLTSACSTARDQDEGHPTATRREISPDSVLLDYSTRKMLISATLEGGRAIWPDTVWVWAFYTSSETGQSGSWSDDPIAVVPAFDANGRALIVAEGGFHWATNIDAPRTGYRARVYVSPSRDSASIRSSLRDRTASTMHRVSVRSNK